MASGFPGSIDNFTDPLSNSSLSSPSHSGLHSDVNDAIEKIETYMGLVKVIPTSVTGGTLAANGTITVGSAVSSVVVSGAFSSLHENYKILYMGGTGTDGDIKLQIGSATTGYYMTFQYIAYSTATATPVSQNNGANFQYAGSSRTTSNSVAVDIYSPNMANYTTLSGVYMGAKAGSGGGATSGVLADTTQHTAFTLIPNVGTLTGGTIRVYGYRN